MMIQSIAKLVVAALLLTGANAPALVSNVNETTATTPTATVSPVEAALQLTDQQAAAIALADAALTLEEVTGLRTRLEKDDRILQWEIAFRSANISYEYEIHAETGKILDKDLDRIPVIQKPDPVPEPVPEPAPEPEPVPTPEPDPTVPADTKLTQQEALQIALDHAGLTAQQVSRVEIEQDRERGVPVYEIEFRMNRMEYAYTIHIENGQILEWEKEIDD